MARDHDTFDIDSPLRTADGIVRPEDLEGGREA
jgi:hypothetical protein